ncbi:MAG: hypothetical protein ACT4PP_13280 [Sporichthyaceae bacterium]
MIRFAQCTVAAPGCSAQLTAPQPGTTPAPAGGVADGTQVPDAQVPGIAVPEAPPPDGAGPDGAVPPGTLPETMPTPSPVGDALLDPVTGEPVGTMSGFGSPLDEVAAQAAQAAERVLRETFGWWLDAPSVSTQAGGSLAVQAMFLGVSALVLTLLVIWQGIRMMVTRRGAPFVEVVRGSMIAGLVIVIGIVVVDGALLAGDQIASAIVGAGFTDSGALVDRMVEVMLADAFTGEVSMLVLIFAVVVLAVCLLTAVFLFLHQIAVPVLGAVLPIAAVGQAGPPATQSWLPRVVTAVLAIVVFKPLVVLVLCVGFLEVSSGSTVLDAIRGAVTLVLAAAVFPVLVRVLSPVSRVILARGEHHSAGSPAHLWRPGSAARDSGTPGDTSAIAHASFMRTNAATAPMSQAVPGAAAVAMGHGGAHGRAPPRGASAGGPAATAAAPGAGATATAGAASVGIAAPGPAPTRPLPPPSVGGPPLRASMSATAFSAGAPTPGADAPVAGITGRGVGPQSRRRRSRR